MEILEVMVLRLPQPMAASTSVKGEGTAEPVRPSGQDSNVAARKSGAQAQLFNRGSSVQLYLFRRVLCSQNTRLRDSEDQRELLHAIRSVQFLGPFETLHTQSKQTSKRASKQNSCSKLVFAAIEARATWQNTARAMVMIIILFTT